LADAPVPLLFATNFLPGVERLRFMGTVKWFDPIRGLGVIGRDGGAADCHVDHSALRGTVCNPLTSGETVEFGVIWFGASTAARDVIRLGFSFVPATIEEGARG
jgi:cold shock CspA family protein